MGDWLAWFDLRYVVVVALGFMALIGLVAVVSPKRFAAISRSSSQWVDTSRWWAVFDRQVDVDTVALRHSRLLGLAVIASSLLLAWLYWTRVVALPLPW
jgi:hypothetical protein